MAEGSPNPISTSAGVGSGSNKSPPAAPSSGGSGSGGGGARLDIEDWYEHLKSLTFQSLFIPFTFQHAKAMVKAIDTIKSKSGQRFTLGATGTGTGAGASAPKPAASPFSNELIDELVSADPDLSELMKFIHTAISENGLDKPDRGVFVRLSKRSPKVCQWIVM